MPSPLRRLHARAEVPPTLHDTQVSVRSVALTILAFAATMYLLHWAQEAFIPIVLSILISFALEPLVVMLTRIRLPRMVAAGLVVTMSGGALVYGMYSLSDDVAAMVAQLPDAAQRLRRTMQRDRTSGPIAQVQQAAAELQKTADQAAPTNPAPRDVTRVQIEEPAINIRQYVTWGSTNAIAFAGQATLVFFFVFFLLASGDLFKRKLVKLAGPSLEKKKITVQILDDINRQIARFLFVRIVTSIVVGVATWIAFSMIGLKQAALWGAAAGVFNTVPYFGPVIVALATAVVAFLQYGTVGMAVYVSGISLVITSIEGWLLTPWLTSRMARTNEVAIFVGLILWSFVWGIWGTLLAVPMLVVVKAYCDHIEGLKSVGELLGE
ncbi:MAG TPA: AI-2E family transporter [Vicinamibacterales bacterium]|jgi:predicted PurR-regulated permease PerM|nr:AI-2E family transporter [Vicinamibacterales bacterium]